jgi:hypothetical protein
MPKSYGDCQSCIHKDDPVVYNIGKNNKKDICRECLYQGIDHFECTNEFKVNDKLIFSNHAPTRNLSKGTIWCEFNTLLEAERAYTNIKTLYKGAE